MTNASFATYRDIGKEIEAAIDAVMWDEEEGAWFDFDSVADRRRELPYTTSTTF